MPTDDTTPTQTQRTIRQLKHKIDTTETQLKRQLREIGITPTKPLTGVHINPQKYMMRQDHYGYMRAKRARNTKHNLQSLQTRLEQVQERAKQENTQP